MSIEFILGVICGALILLAVLVIIVTIQDRLSLWSTKWVEPRYGLKLHNYKKDMLGWIDGHETKVVKVNARKNKIKVRKLKKGEEGYGGF